MQKGARIVLRLEWAEFKMFPSSFYPVLAKMQSPRVTCRIFSSIMVGGLRLRLTGPGDFASLLVSPTYALSVTWANHCRGLLAR